MQPAQAAHAAGADGNLGPKRFTQKRTECFGGPVFEIVGERQQAQNCGKARKSLHATISFVPALRARQ